MAEKANETPEGESDTIEIDRGQSGEHRNGPPLTVALRAQRHVV